MFATEKERIKKLITWKENTKSKRLTHTSRHLTRNFLGQGRFCGVKAL